MDDDDAASERRRALEYNLERALSGWNATTTASIPTVNSLVRDAGRGVDMDMVRLSKAVRMTGDLAASVGARRRSPLKQLNYSAAPGGGLLRRLGAGDVASAARLSLQTEFENALASLERKQARAPRPRVELPIPVTSPDRVLDPSHPIEGLSADAFALLVAESKRANDAQLAAEAERDAARAEADGMKDRMMQLEAAATAGELRLAQQAEALNAWTSYRGTMWQALQNECGARQDAVAAVADAEALAAEAEEEADRWREQFMAVEREARDAIQRADGLESQLSSLRDDYDALFRAHTALKTDAAVAAKENRRAVQLVRTLDSTTSGRVSTSHALPQL